MNKRSQADRERLLGVAVAGLVVLPVEVLRPLAEVIGNMAVRVSTALEAAAGPGVDAATPLAEAPAP